MRLNKKLLGKSFYKISTILFLVGYNVMPVALAAEEISNLNTDSNQSVSVTTEEASEVPNEVPVDTSEDILEEGISDPEWIAKPVKWESKGGKYVTDSPVVLNEKYVSPQNSEVSVTFSKLPEKASSLSIEEIILTQEEMDATGAVSNKAYDITTDMVDGTFEFDLTLPKVGKAEKVVYAEERSEILTNPKEVRNNVVVEKDVVRVEGLEHFTIFIVVNPDDTDNQNSVVNPDGAWVSDNNYATFNGNNDRADYAFPNLYITNGATITGIEVSVEGKTTGRDLQISLRRGTATYTSTKLADLDTAEKTIVLGGNGDLWGTTWNSNNFGNNFRVRVASATGTGTASLDMVNVKVYVNDSSIPVPVLENNPSDLYALTSVSGIWTNINGGIGHQGIGGNEIRWGTPAGDIKSGLRFSPGGAQSFNEFNESNPLEKIYIGTLSHLNWVTNSGTSATGATLEVTLDFARPDIENQTFTYDFLLDETPNRWPCGQYQQSGVACDDIITFPNSYGGGVFEIGYTKYTLVIDGFVNKFPSGNPLAKFVTEEQKDNSAFLVGHLSSICFAEPAISIKKLTNGEDANDPTGPFIGEGEVVTWTYIVQNTGDVPLYDIVVTDNPVETITCPGTTLEAGKSMTCTAEGVAKLGQYRNVATVNGHCALGTQVTASDPSHYFGVKKVDICHATDSHSNPYTGAKASMTADAGGHDGHNGPVWFPGIQEKWGDIIPPFDYQGGHYPGKNYDAYGQSVLANGCTVPTGTLKVNKVTVPAGDSTQFGITGTGSSVEGAPTFMNGNTGTISSNTPHTFTVYPGTYSVSETPVDGWTETGNTCKDIVIAKGENKECTITNARYGSLTIVKNANPSSEQVFSFTTTGTGLSAFTLVDNSNSSNPNKVFENLLPGTYSVSETVPSGWYLDSASCSDGSPLTAINLSAGENITCTFNNIKYGSISGHKWNDFDGIAGTADDKLNPIQGWTIFIDANNNNILDAGEVYMLTGVGGLYTFSNLKPGTYKIMEVLQVGWINITGKSQEITITAGENKTDIDFSNAKYPTIQVIKKVDSDGDGVINIENATDWTWKIGTTDTYNTGIAPVEKMPGTYTISEVQKGGYHVTSLVCTKGGTEIYNGVSESTSIVLQSGDNVVCTFTNTRDTGTLIVKKVVVNDNGGTLLAKDFSFKVDNGNATLFIPTADPLLGENTITKVLTGTYSITEVEANQRGYTTTYDKCSEVTVSKGNETICTITNNDNKPSLTLVKEVVNDNGGQLKPGDWTLTATGPVTVTGAGGATSGNDFEAGTYTLSEVGKTGVDVSGYEAGNWSCTNNIAVSNNQITIGLGQSTVCTIINNDIAPSLELVKVVENGFGGNAVKTDWTLTATGTLTEPTNLSGAGGVTSGTGFKADTYTLAETGSVTGYSASNWSCTNNISVSNNQITLGLGKSTVCTITNTEIQPTLTLVKTVVNSYGGNKGIADFNLYIGDTKVTSGVVTGVSSGVEYTVKEDQLSGYTASTWGTDCSTDGKITLKSGENKTCTITNSDIAPTLKVVKKAINDNGGTATISNFGITLTDTTLSFGNGVANGTTTTYEATPTVVSNKAYTLGETGATGYTQESLQCLDGETNLGSTFTLNPGQNVICTIVNNDIAPKLTLNKIVSNTHGGSKLESAWTLYAKTGEVTSLSGFGAAGDNDVVSDGKFMAGSYTLSEQGPTGYDASTWSCTGTGSLTGNVITLTVGQEAVCSITNSDRAAGLTVVKNVINDNGGTAVVGNFEIKLNNNLLAFGTGSVNGTTTTYTSTPSVDSNTAYTLSEIDHVGYVEGTWSCKDNSTELPVSHPVTLSEGQGVTCTITNNDIAPTLKLVKSVTNDNGGTLTPADWRLTATGAEGFSDSGNSTTFHTVKAGVGYTLSESVVAGYASEGWKCDKGTLNGSTITLGLADNVTCTITNNDIAPTLKLVKKVTNDNGGTLTPADWRLTATGAEGFSDTGDSTTFHTVKAGVGYTLSESVVAGYASEGWKCDKGTLNGSTITLGLADNVTCTITNNDIAPTLKLVKKVTNDNGGTLTPADWRLTATGAEGFSDSGNSTTFHTVKAGVGYTLSESVVAGYASEGWKCDKGTLNGSTITLGLADNVTCTITNNDIQPKLTVIKVVENGTYGDKKVENFTLYVSGTPVTSRDTNSYNAGNYTVSEDNIDGYVATISGDCDKDGKVSLSVGDEKSCTITNRSTHGKIIIKKLVEPNTDTTTFSFTGDLTGTIGNNGTIEKIVVPGDYSVTETSTTGWNLKDLTCVDATNDSVVNGYTANIKVADNETVTCTFTNEKLGKISGYKYEDKNGNKTWDAGEVALSGWTINNGQGGTTTTNDSGYYEFINLPVGSTYTITETLQDGWTQISTNPSAITIKAGDDIKNINFGNFKHATINVTKDVVGIDGVTDVKDDTTFTAQLNEADGKIISEKTTATYPITEPGLYTVSEFDVIDYVPLGCFLGKDEFTKYSVESGQTYNVVCKNKQKAATLIVTKNVVDSNKTDEGVFSDEQFDIVLGEETKQISDTANGKNKATFEGLQPGEHTFTETPKDGFIFEGCTNDGKVTLESNKKVDVVCTNKVIDPVLEIEKSNDKQFIDQYAGDEVTYKIIVTAPDDTKEGTYIVKNAIVSDIAPSGFNYLTGTWTAQKNGLGISVSEPTYDGKNIAKWDIGDMKEGDVVTLTYKTKISLLTDPGVYPDIAWVKGVSVSNNDVLGNVSTGATTPFVGTDVTVIEPVETEEGEVLGATTYLPNTGASSYLTLGALITMILGILALLFKPFKKVKYALLSLVMVFGFFVMVLPTTVSAYDTLQVRIEKPQSPTAKKSFNIDFTAQDVNEGAITVDCYKDAVKFASFTANSGSCPVTVADSGTYSFYVIATAGVETKQSDTVTVVVDLATPSPVTGYSKSGNVLTFTTANDGRTSKVEIFRSDKSSFTANATTRIGTMNVLPNTSYTYTDSTAEAGKTYYYALRAVDSIGNVSGLVADKVVATLPAETTTLPTSQTTTTGVDGVDAKEENTDNNGEVAGATEETESADTGNKGEIEVSELPGKVVESVKNKWYLWGAGIIVLAGLVYIYVRSKKRN